MNICNTVRISGAAKTIFFRVDVLSKKYQIINIIVIGRIEMSIVAPKAKQIFLKIWFCWLDMKFPALYTCKMSKNGLNDVRTIILLKFFMVSNGFEEFAIYCLLLWSLEWKSFLHLV